MVMTRFRQAEENIARMQQQLETTMKVVAEIVSAEDAEDQDQVVERKAKNHGLCPKCFSTSTGDFSLNGETQAHCRDCGHVFQSPGPTPVPYKDLPRIEIPRAWSPGAPPVGMPLGPMTLEEAARTEDLKRRTESMWQPATARTAVQPRRTDDMRKEALAKSHSNPDADALKAVTADRDNLLATVKDMQTKLVNTLKERDQAQKTLGELRTLYNDLHTRHVAHQAGEQRAIRELRDILYRMQKQHVTP